MERIDKLISGFISNQSQRNINNRKSSTQFKRTNNSQASEGFNFLELIYNWSEIVGPRLSKHTIPLKNTYNNLTILTDHSSYSQQLSFMEEALKKKITKKYPSLLGKINRVKFQTDPSFFKKQYENLILKKENKSKECKKQNHAFSPEYRAKKAKATKAFNHIEDDEIKKELESLFIQIKD